jgi:iron complex outermembrane receptor protein
MYKDSANLQKIDGSTIFDLGVHYQTEIASHPVRFDLNVANLTDENYWATSYSLGIPRNVAFSVKYGF